MCGGTTGTCVTTVVGKSVKSSCPYAFTFKLAVAKSKKENVLRECPVPLCTALPWAVNMKSHMARCHPNIGLDTIDCSEWYVTVPAPPPQKRTRRNLCPYRAHVLH